MNRQLINLMKSAFLIIIYLINYISSNKIRYNPSSLLTQKDLYRVNNLYDPLTYGVKYATSYNYLDNQDEVKNFLFSII